MNNDSKNKLQADSENDITYDGSNALSISNFRDNLPENNHMDEYRKQLGKDVFDFYFEQDVKGDIRELLSDCISKEKWGVILEKYKEGAVDKDELVDILLLSHLHAVERENPIASAEEIMDRAFETKMKGKLGRKLISATISSLSEAQLLTAPKEAVQALLFHTASKEDVRAETEEDRKLLPAQAETEQLKAVSESAYNSFLNSLNVEDLIRDIGFDELLARIDDEEDPYFGITHQIVFDIGWELVSRKSKEKKLSLYVSELDKAWTDTLESNVKVSDRHVTRYLISDVKEGEVEKINRIKDALVKKYSGRLEEKIGFFNVIWTRDAAKRK